MKNLILTFSVLTLLGAGCARPAAAPISVPAAEEPKAAAVRPEEPAPAVVEARQPIVTLAASGEAWTVTADGKKITEIPWPVGHDGPTAKIVAQTAANVFVSTCPGGLGGAYIYAACPLGLIQVDLATGQRKDLAKAVSGVFQDISAPGMMVAWSDVNSKKIVIKSLLDGSVKRVIDVRDAADFGDAVFSPDGKSIAYSVLMGDRLAAIEGSGAGKFSSQVVTVDIISGNRIVVAEKKNAVFSVRGWKDASTVDYYER